MTHLKAILIDDEQQGLNVLTYELGRLHAGVEIIGSFTNPEEGLTSIRDLHPDLVFLDIEMPWMNGFELLDQLDEIDFDVIFVTAFDQFAIKAFRYYALDYLLKPVDAEMLQETLERVRQKRQGISKAHLQSLMRELSTPHDSLSRIALPTMEGLEMIDIADIVRCEANDTYSFIHLRNAHRLLISKPLRYLDELLQDAGFYRVHQSHLINLRHVHRFVKADGGYLVMSDNAQVQVSRRKKDGLLERLQGIKK